MLSQCLLTIHIVQVSNLAPLYLSLVLHEIHIPFHTLSSLSPLFTLSSPSLPLSSHHSLLLLAHLQLKHISEESEESFWPKAG